MTPKTILFFRAKTLCFGAAIILTMLVLFVAVAGPAAHAQTYSLMYAFGIHPGDPLSPSGLLTQGRDGNLYGTSGYGGNGWGTVFKVAPTGTMTVIYNFDQFLGNPGGGLILGTDGNFYGATGLAVFKVTPAGELTVLHRFEGADGAGPCPPIQGTDGNFYGITQYGGAGTVYKITPSGDFKTLYDFQNAPNGASTPNGPLVQGTDGAFYGTTAYSDVSGGGTVFKITAVGQLTVLHDFGFTHAAYPIAPLFQANDGNLYGTTLAGGQKNDGVVFKMTPSGKISFLHSFTVNEGVYTLAGLTQATDGNLYGVSSGVNRLFVNDGTIYRSSLSGDFSVLYIFDGITGERPESTLFQHTNGLLYGDTVNGGSSGPYEGPGVFFNLDIGAAPFVRLVSTAGHIAKNIGILGQGFTGTTSVSFNSIPASFIVSSDTYLETTVPDGALTGPVTVTTPTGTLTSNTAFRVTPKVLSFSPTSGPVGTPVVITGKGLTQTLRVGFGAVAATSFTVDSDTQITAMVPTGAVTGKIAVATQGGHDTGARVFTVMP